jgi:hypothetical protein
MKKTIKINVSLLGLGVFPLLLASAQAQPRVFLRENEQMRINLDASSVAQEGSNWRVIAPMANDNDFPEGVLPASFRRWWHFGIENLNPETGETLIIEVRNSGSTQIITPVWSLDDGATWTRLPPGHNQQYLTTNATLRFTVQVPAGVDSILLAKWFPYTPANFEDFRARISGDPAVNATVLGASILGRPIHHFEVTDTSIPNSEKKRVWIHNCVHPAENTGYYMMEGLMDWLLSGTPEARAVLQQLVFDIVPVANPDGLALGNYRTNSAGDNLENQWTPPYNSTVPESVALRNRIEQLMGTPDTPGDSPIVMLLNIHASHGDTAPFHFVHRPFYNSNGTGVIQTVTDLELKWVGHFRARSPWVNRGTDNWSTRY